MNDAVERNYAMVSSDARGVVTVTISNAGSLNILSSAVMQDVADTIAELSARSDLRVIVLRGSGETSFVAGADVHEMIKLDQVGATAFISRLYNLCEAVRRCPVPVIARISGWCLGGGLQLAACCDIRIASEDAQFGMPEVRIGMASIIHSALLPRLIGETNARWLLLTGEMIDATQALDWNLVTKVVAATELDGAIEATVRAILLCGADSIRAQKEVLRVWERQPVDTAVEQTIPLFAAAFAAGEPQKYMQAFIDAHRPSS